MVIGLTLRMDTFIGFDTLFVTLRNQLMHFKIFSLFNECDSSICLTLLQAPIRNVKKMKIMKFGNPFSLNLIPEAMVQPEMAFMGPSGIILASEENDPSQRFKQNGSTEVSMTPCLIL